MTLSDGQTSRARHTTSDPLVGRVMILAQSRIGFRPKPYEILYPKVACVSVSKSLQIS